MPGRPWTAKDRDRLRAWMAGGRTAAWCAAALGRTEQAVRRFATTNRLWPGVKAARGLRARALLLDLLRHTHTAVALARTAGLSESLTRFYLEDLVSRGLVARHGYPVVYTLTRKWLGDD